MYNEKNQELNPNFNDLDGTGNISTQGGCDRMMITHNQQAPGGNSAPECATALPVTDLSVAESSIKKFILPPSLQMHHPIATHHPQAGLNPMVDAAGYLFTIMGQLNTTENFCQFDKLQKELMHEIDVFESAVKLHHYNGEYIQVSRYVICAVLDSLISNTAWGGNNEWEPYSLLGAYELDKDHEGKFFSILEHAIKEPAYYIDLMELMYICLSIGYSGDAQGSEHDQDKLEQITNSLYKYIRAYRGHVSKALSPTPIRSPRPAVNQKPHEVTSFWTVLFFTACVITTLFIGLGYLMEMISNEAISNFSDIQKTVARKNL